MSDGAEPAQRGWDYFAYVRLVNASDLPGPWRDVLKAMAFEVDKNVPDIDDTDHLSLAAIMGQNWRTVLRIRKQLREAGLITAVDRRGNPMKETAGRTIRYRLEWKALAARKRAWQEPASRKRAPRSPLSEDQEPLSEDQELEGDVPAEPLSKDQGNLCQKISPPLIKDQRTPDLLTDNPLPPLPPQDRSPPTPPAGGASPTNHPLRRRTDPSNAPPEPVARRTTPDEKLVAEVGKRKARQEKFGRNVAWLVARMLEHLQVLEDRGGGVEAELVRYEQVTGLIVARWLADTRPKRVKRKQLDGSVEKVPLWRIQDTPDSVEKAEVRAALLEAARRWRVGERPPPPNIVPRRGSVGWFPPPTPPDSPPTPPDETYLSPDDDLIGLIGAERAAELGLLPPQRVG